MSGIHRIQQLRTNAQKQQMQRTSVPSQEFYFRDGDQAFIAPIATGNEDDKYFDNVEMYTWPKAMGGFNNLLKHDSVDAGDVPEDVNASQKFTFWAYVFEVIHSTLTERGREAGWEPIKAPTGKQLYKEDVNAFKIISLSYGRNEYVFNQLYDIYNDWGSLNKGIIRIKRTGTGMQDTSYTIAATTRELKVPEPENELPTIEQYYLERYSEVWAPEGSSNGTGDVTTKPVTQADIDELF